MSRRIDIRLLSALLLTFGMGSARASSEAGESAPQAPHALLQADAVRDYVQTFNSTDHTHFGQAISNEAAADWMAGNVPLFECPDKEIEEIYHFRWWTFRKHIKQTPDGFVITEFLPKVNWSGKHNTISCPAGHHFREGRWIRDPQYLDDYAVFWFRKGGSPRRYSFWAADAIYHRALVHGDFSQAIDLLPDLVANYEAWEQSRLEPDGLFWQIDDRDGMEVSIGGKRSPRPGQTRDDQLLHVRRCRGHRRHRRAGRQAGDRQDVHAKRRSESNGSSWRSSGTTTRSSSRSCPAARRPSWSTSANCTGSRPGISTCRTRARVTRSRGNS